MKVKLLLLALVLTALTACSSMRFGKSANAVAHIKSLDGNAEIARGSAANWEPARIWANLHSGDRARTAPHGQIDFSLGKYGGVLTLMPESTIIFEQLGPASPDSKIVGVFNLVEGRVVGDTLRLPPGARVQIRTADGVHEIP